MCTTNARVVSEEAAGLHADSDRHFRTGTTRFQCEPAETKTTTTCA